MKKALVLVASILLVLVLGNLTFHFLNRPNKDQLGASVHVPPKVTPGENTYHRPILKKKHTYNIFLIGDSMTAALGPRGGIFTELISKEYPDNFFEVSNYAKGGQNVEEMSGRLNEPFEAAKDAKFKPIMQGNPDIIIIESFGYNPLSEDGIKVGMEKQRTVMAEMFSTLEKRFPNTVIMFMATIAPDKKTYAQSLNHTRDGEGWAQAEERIGYITNHIDYALENNIPLINVYQESLDELGDGDTKYINPDDDIHPSAEGLALIARVMTRRIKEEKIIP